MTDETAIQKAPEQEALSTYLRNPVVIEKFTMILGNDRAAMRYVQSVILLVETAEPGDYSLKNCTPRSVLRCALKAATQKVTVNAEDREAFMIPNRNKAGQLEARFQFHYQEIFNRAMRSGNYRIINVSSIYEGTLILEDVYTGLHRVVLDNGLAICNESAPVLRKWNEGDGKKRIGWLGYMKDRDGREKTIFLSIEEIERRAQFNKTWSSSFGWKNHREAMEKKTVLLALLRLADLKAKGNEALAASLEAETDDDFEEIGGETGEIVDAETSESEPAESEISEAEAAYINACEVTDKNGEKYGDKKNDALSKVINSEAAPEEKKRAAQIIVDWRAAKLAAEKAANEKALQELGY